MQMFIAVDTEKHLAFGPFSSELKAEAWAIVYHPTDGSEPTDQDYWAYYEVEYVDEDEDEDLNAMVAAVENFGPVVVITAEGSGTGYLTPDDRIILDGPLS